MITGEFDKAVSRKRKPNFNGGMVRLFCWRWGLCIGWVAGWLLCGWLCVCVCVCVCYHCLVGIGASRLACSLPFVFSTSRVHR
jgi:hypothetical protein